MAVLWITYELRQPERDYGALYAAIKTLGKCARPLEATWFVDTRETAPGVRNLLKMHLGPSDTLLVMPAAHGWAGVKISQSFVSWLNTAQY